MTGSIPPPLPSAVGWRSMAAGIAGGVAYAATLFRFLTYQQRNRLGAGSYLAFAVAALVIGFVAALGTGRGPYRVAGSVLLGVFVAHAGVIAIDLKRDPTDHNLLPFEFVWLGVCAAPAYVGAAASRLIKR